MVVSHQSCGCWESKWCFGRAAKALPSCLSTLILEYAIQDSFMSAHEKRGEDGVGKSY